MFVINLIKALIIGIHDEMKWNNQTLKNAILEEYYMIKNVMGLDLYVKYMNGTAVEGVDYFENIDYVGC